MRDDAPTTAASAVSCRGVIKYYGTTAARAQALQGADLDVGFGEMTVLVGPSGSGKTTLVSAMTGILTPDAGSIRVLGEEIAGRKASYLAHFRSRRIGIVLQQFHLFPALTALENVAVPLLVQGLSRKLALSRSGLVLTDLGLEHHLDRYPRQLSVGEQQRVAIGRALVHNPALIICDEPTAALDSTAGQAAMRLLRRVALEPSRAVVVVTHDDRIVPFADRIAHMRDGQVTHVETIRKLEAA